MEKRYIIYCHKNKVNGKCYIGQTCQTPKKRWKNGNGYLDGSQPKFEKAIKKYGWDAFESIILHGNLTLDEANKLEIELIKKYNSIKNGYNISTGGNGNPGHTLSKEVRQKIADAQRGKPGHRLGVRLTAEQRKQLSIAHQGQKSPFKGKKAPKEQVEKMIIKVLQAIKDGKIVKKVQCIETGIIYNSLTEASKTLNIQECNISRCAQGKRKTAGGYHWKYIDKEKD